jgi:predicted flap endonuclease-1-like 5' DNA nuclease
VQEVKGIGPATAESLKKKRITNLAHLASTEPGKLAEILDISEVRAMAFIDEARRLLTIEE